MVSQNTITWLRLSAGDLFRALIAMILLASLQLYCAARPLGRVLEHFEYAFLQQALASQSRAEDSQGSSRLPVVVDISTVNFDRSLPTDRDQIAELVDELEKLGASAIGLDIDFSPDDQGNFISPRDPKLFNDWMRLRNVRVGVFRREGLAPDQWLGRSEFRDLAAGIRVPESDVQHAYYFTSAATSAAYLVQLPAALSEVIGESSVPRFGSSEDRTLIRRPLGAGIGSMEVGEYVIDYSFLGRIPSVPYTDPQHLRYYGEQIQGRVVLVGDLRDSADANCTGQSRTPVAGVLVHACAFASLTHGRLLEIDRATSRRYDVYLFAIVTALLSGARALQMFRRGGVHFNLHVLEIALYTTAAVAVFGGCFFFLHVTRLFWPDFLWISTALFFQPYFAELMGISTRAVRAVFAAPAREVRT
jgi:CHASE2 domain-containing sensor protein